MQFVDKRVVNMLLATYFAVIGAFALAATVDPVLVQLFGIKVSFRAGFSPMQNGVLQQHWLDHAQDLLGTNMTVT